MTVTIVDWAKKVNDPVHTDTVCSVGNGPWRMTMEMLWHAHDNTPSLPFRATTGTERHAL